MKNEHLLAGAVLFRKKNGKTSWFLVQSKGKDYWELPKGIVRKGESSVRTAIRTIGEMAGLQARVLEEAGRGVEQGNLIVYYLMQHRNSSSSKSNYSKVSWVPYYSAKQKLSKSWEKKIIMQAKQVLHEWLKTNY